MTPNETAYLAMIAACEGTVGAQGYQALFGYTPSNGRIFDNGFATHPHIFVPYTMLDGTRTQSSAAGRYQIIWATFCDLQNKLMTHDFTPATQDLMALRLISDAGALGLVDHGRLQEAIDVTAGIWASLPASHYSEPKRTYSFALSAYTMAGGTVAIA
jgi:muramidase (phage lysozyme)